MAGDAHTHASAGTFGKSFIPSEDFQPGQWGARGESGVAPLSPAPLLQLITEQADIPLSRGAEMKGKCGTNESELELSWMDQAYTLKLSFLKVRAPLTPGPGAGTRRLCGGPDRPCLGRRGTTRPGDRRRPGGSAGSSSPTTPPSAPTSRMPSAVSARAQALRQIPVGERGAGLGGELLAKCSLREKGNPKPSRQSQDQLPGLNSVYIYI